MKTGWHKSLCRNVAASFKDGMVKHLFNTFNTFVMLSWLPQKIESISEPNKLLRLLAWIQISGLPTSFMVLARDTSTMGWQVEWLLRMLTIRAIYVSVVCFVQVYHLSIYRNFTIEIQMFLKSLIVNNWYLN